MTILELYEYASCSSTVTKSTSTAVLHRVLLLPYGKPVKNTFLTMAGKSI